jgi:hypothetical protein
MFLVFFCICIYLYLCMGCMHESMKLCVWEYGDVCMSIWSNERMKLCVWAYEELCVNYVGPIWIWRATTIHHEALESRPHRAGVGSPLRGPPLGSHEKKRRATKTSKQQHNTHSSNAWVVLVSCFLLFSFLCFSKKNISTQNNEVSPLLVDVYTYT